LVGGTTIGINVMASHSSIQKYNTLQNSLNHMTSHDLNSHMFVFLVSQSKLVTKFVLLKSCRPAHSNPNPNLNLSAPVIQFVR